MGKSGLADLTEGYEERIKALGRVRMSSRKRARRRRRSQPHARGASERERGIDSPDALRSWRLLAAKDAQLADGGGECLAESRHRVGARVAACVR